MTSSILAEARRGNAQHGITGVLCQGQGFFVQVLEGQRKAVNQLYRQIVHDPRHREVEVLLLEDIAQRRYAQWSMAHVLLSDSDPRVLMQDPAFDPYAMPGRVLLARLDELLASGHPIRAVVD